MLTNNYGSRLSSASIKKIVYLIKSTCTVTVIGHVLEICLIKLWPPKKTPKKHRSHNLKFVSTEPSPIPVRLPE